MNDITRSLHQGRERLARDVRALIQDGEDVLRHAAEDAGGELGEARSRLAQSLQAARTRITDIEHDIADGAAHAGKAADSHVRRHPWQSIAAVAAVGLLAGLLLARK